MMMYAGIELPIASSALTEWVEQFISPSEAYEFNAENGRELTACIPVPPVYEVPPVRLGTLYWPTDASRWAVYHTVLTGTQLATLRATLLAGNPLSKAGYPAADLVLDDGRQDPITAEMYLLPPKPISGWFPEPASLSEVPGDDDYREPNDLYLVTLVDVRYFWWFRYGDVTIPVSNTWKGMAEQILTLLEETATVPSTFGQDYPKAKADRWVVKAAPLPLLLDGIARNVGRRVVRKVDGTIEFQTWEEARVAAKTLFLRQYSEDDQEILDLRGEDFGRLAGGMIDYEDLRRSVPASIKLLYGSGYTNSQTVTLAALAIPEYLGYTGREDEVATVRMEDLDPTTEAPSAITYAQKYAKDWYGWQLANYDVTLAGIAPWDGCGWQDAVRWSPGSTRVIRGPWGTGTAAGLCREGGSATFFLAVLTAKDHFLGPFIAYSWRRVNDSATPNPLTYTLHTDQGGPGTGLGPAYSEQNVDYPVYSGAGSPPPDATVWIRKSNNYWLIEHDPRWEYVEIDPTQPIVSGSGTNYNQGYLLRYDQGDRTFKRYQQVLIRRAQEVSIV